MSILIHYEWLLEFIETESGEDDITEVMHFDTYAGMMEWLKHHPVGPGERVDLGMVCDDERGGGQRSWALLEGGKLEHEFRDAMGNVTRKMPDRFFHEVNRYHNWDR